MFVWTNLSATLRSIGVASSFLLAGLNSHAFAGFTSDCVESADVFVDDQTGTFFSPITRKQFEAVVDNIGSLAMSKVEVGLKPKSELSTCKGNDFKGEFTGIKNDEGRCVRDESVTNSTQSKSREGAQGLVIRTVWKGGQRDLRFIDRPATPEEAKVNIHLMLRYLSNGTPQMTVRGDTCEFESSANITMNPSFPEQVHGYDQNYKHFASFVAHQLVKLTDVEGCNLGSEAKNIIVQMTAGGKKQAVPAGFELRSREADATEDERYERASYPSDNPELASDGKAVVGIFNRPTELIYRVEHPLYPETWEEIHIKKIESDYICGVFDLGEREKSAIGSQLMDIPSGSLDPAILRFRLDMGSSFFLRNPGLSFRVRWLSPGPDATVVSESKFVMASDSVDGGIAEFELAGAPPYPTEILPGRYKIELDWKSSLDTSVIKTISFFWSSTEGHNVADYFGVLGPLRLDFPFSSGRRVSTYIMREYFLQQRLEKELIQWEQWPEPHARRFADGILWHFRNAGALPYLSAWDGKAGVAAELVRALSVVTADNDWVITQDAETALEFLSKIDRIPDNFDRFIALRRAMCQLSSQLEGLGEPVPALWMDCR